MNIEFTLGVTPLAAFEHLSKPISLSIDMSARKLLVFFLSLYDSNDTNYSNTYLRVIFFFNYKEKSIKKDFEEGWSKTDFRDREHCGLRLPVVVWSFPHKAYCR